MILKISSYISIVIAMENLFCYPTCRKILIRIILEVLELNTPKPTNLDAQKHLRSLSSEKYLDFYSLTNCKKL